MSFPTKIVVKIQKITDTLFQPGGPSVYITVYPDIVDGGTF